MPKLSDAEMARYRSSLYGVAAIGHVPKARAYLSLRACPPQGLCRLFQGLAKEHIMQSTAISLLRCCFPVDHGSNTCKFQFASFECFVDLDSRIYM